MPAPQAHLDLAELRTDLARFTFLLGHDDGEQLFGTGETDPPTAGPATPPRPARGATRDRGRYSPRK
jgi:hypothetical protein